MYIYIYIYIHIYIYSQEKYPPKRDRAIHRIPEIQHKSQTYPNKQRAN